MKLTVKEKAVVAQYLKEDPTWVGVVRSYWPFFLPALIFGMYGIVKQDAMACSIGFVLLIFFAIWFFYQGGLLGVHLKSALRKYEQEVSALGE